MLLVSQGWLAVDVLLAVFSLVAVLADPMTSLVPLRVSRWQSRVVLRWDSPLSEMLFLNIRFVVFLVENVGLFVLGEAAPMIFHPGFTGPRSVLVLSTIFPFWTKETRFAAAVSWSARRSRTSRVTPSAVPQVWYLQEMEAWTSTKSGSSGAGAWVFRAHSSCNMSRTTPLLTVVVADSCCAATTKDELGCQSPHTLDACLDATAVGLAEGLIDHEDLLRTGLCHCRAISVSSEDDFDDDPTGDSVDAVGRREEDPTGDFEDARRDDDPT